MKPCKWIVCIFLSFFHITPSNVQTVPLSDPPDQVSNPVNCVAALGAALILIFLLFTNVALATGYVITHEQAGCGTNPVQDWYYRCPPPQNAQDWEECPYYKEFSGVFRKVKLNASGITCMWCDNDWNIFVMPDDSSLATNAYGQVNGSMEDLPAGNIELEVMSPWPITDYFNNNDNIRAGGMWVQDGGHSMKSELHPLRWMMTVGDNPFSLFVTQDQSARFIDASYNFDQQFDFSIPLPLHIVTPDFIEPSSTSLLTEDASVQEVDISALQSPGTVTLNMSVPAGGWYDCEQPARVITYPGYLGGLEYSTANLINDSINYKTTHLVDTGQKCLSVEIKSALSNPPQGELAYSEWIYDYSVGGTASTTITEAPHHASYNEIYCPAEGYNKNEWSLSILASTKDPSYDSESPSTSRNVTYVQEKRIYKLPSSKISWNALYKEVRCGGPVYFNLDDTKLLKDVNLVNLTVRAREVSRRDSLSEGQFPITYGPWLTLENGLETETYKVEMYSAPIPNRLDIIFKESIRFTTFLGLELETSGETDIGEIVTYHNFARTNCGISSMSYDELREYVNRYLQSHGYPLEPYKWDRVINSKPSIGKRIHIMMGGLDDRKAIELYRKWLFGYKLSEKELDSIVKMANEGSKLPETKKPERKFTVHPRSKTNRTTIQIK